MVNFSDAIEIDLHSMNLFDAELEICESLEEAWCTEKKVVLFIHGFNNGFAIGDYIRNPGRLKKQLKLGYPHLPEIRLVYHDRGSTYAIFQKSSLTS